MCVFCSIAAHETAAQVILEDDDTVAFLDHRPLFAGHCLLIPRAHFVTLGDLPRGLLDILWRNAQLLTTCVERAMEAQGTFVAVNNKVSQSVPHFHIHVVPRRRKDGLKGFFWPRHPYRDDAEMASTAERIRRTLQASTSREP
ncbi:MAG: HIT family protein [Actinomycetota bacterium]|nr:HIT family protein [Actinomycetota bacterium]